MATISQPERSHNEKHIHLKMEDIVVSNMFANAASATDKERKMSLLQGIRLYPKAIFWAALISMCCAMEGYDIALIGNFYAFPSFNRKYGELQPNGTYQVPAKWQAGISNGAQVGQIFGLCVVTGIGVERFGYRPFILGILSYQCVLTTTFFMAPRIEILLLAECLAGIAFGVFMSVAISYASEVCPVALRGYLTTWGNSCWLLWLVRQGRYKDAEKSLIRLISPKSDPSFDAAETVDMICHTNELEKDLTQGASYLDCFKGANSRRTEIVCMLFVSQNLAGNTFSNYSTYFIEQAGLSGEMPYNFALGQYGLNTVGAFVTWAFMAWGVERRTLYLFGLTGLFCTLLVHQKSPIPHFDSNYLSCHPSVEQMNLALNISETIINFHRPYYAKALHDDNDYRTNLEYAPSFLTLMERCAFHVFGSALCLGTLVLRDPVNTMSAYVLTQIDIAIDLFTSLLHHGAGTPRYHRNLEWLLKLRARASFKMSAASTSRMAGSQRDANPDWRRRSEVEEDSEDLELLGWRTRLIERAGQTSQTVSGYKCSRSLAVNNLRGHQCQMGMADTMMSGTQLPPATPDSTDDLLHDFWDPMLLQDIFGRHQDQSITSFAKRPEIVVGQDAVQQQRQYLVLRLHMSSLSSG
ncbi:hypothetical protein K458DRAFT_411013 [Lentithecium fluviatile CBS 122367]|uniref:MFS general substrate transporter n=1 Tax=Lentithecium fluviatile CBS 122367 TaxID=1168545 RepID=A0A6G1IBX4_9PLEO|nr:hypothetical protein K458DRAFT_411013 [Lentithecium fluviatile CBS 122367]